jgi:hypothetical protein
MIVFDEADRKKRDAIIGELKYMGYEMRTVGY